MEQYTIYLAIAIAKVGSHLPTPVLVIHNAVLHRSEWLCCPSYRRAMIWQDAPSRADFLRCTELCKMWEGEVESVFDQFSATPAALEKIFFLNFMRRLVRRRLINEEIASEAFSRTLQRLTPHEWDVVSDALQRVKARAAGARKSNFMPGAEAYDMASMSLALPEVQQKGEFDMKDLKSVLGEVAKEKVESDKDWDYIDRPIPEGQQLASKRIEVLVEDWTS
ncbi:hypothetical protein BDW74DRAFT_181211 [Aspergillus multicolor]|uniref:uncharacterized protein n=1 Tax=Aspergillus multicolor TaxID=41759 RepID=UPI003CCCFE71